MSLASWGWNAYFSEAFVAAGLPGEPARVVSDSGGYYRVASAAGEAVGRGRGSLAERPVTGDWIHAAFTKPEVREPWMHEALAESDALVDELLEADLIVAGVPMYNFGVPAGFKAYIDNIVRVGRTFGFDRSRQGLPYWPMLTEMNKRLVLLGARGDYGYEPGERLAHTNHVEPHLRTVFGYLGIKEVHSIAAEYDEFADERLQTSLARAERRIAALVSELANRLEERLIPS